MVFRLSKKMREDARLSDVPVILVTAKGTEIDKVRGLDAGADDYIAKLVWYFGNDFPREGRTAPQQKCRKHLLKNYRQETFG